ncbi:MAG: hypothetical protein ACUVRZ_12795 [Desulfobacca sp.]|uniref:hypothetical protein n=1 Tax=Desulfobacca sp. TaxID=2067990 RepID=UPI004049B36F
MRTLACCVMLFFFCLGMTGTGWSQREVPPPADLPLDAKPALVEPVPVKPAPPAVPAAVATPQKPAAKSPTPPPTVVKRQTGKPNRAAQTPVLGTQPATTKGPKKLAAKTKAGKASKVASSTKKPGPPPAAPKKSEAAKLAKKPAAKKVHRAATIPLE